MKQYCNIIEFAESNFSDNFFSQIVSEKGISTLNIKYLILLELQFCTHFEDYEVSEYATITLKRMEREICLDPELRDFTNYVISQFKTEIILQRMKSTV